MLIISSEQLARFDRVKAFVRLREFVNIKCKNKPFVQWLDQQFEATGTPYQWPKNWELVWPHAEHLPEVNAMLMLTFVSVCEFEKKLLRPIADLVDQSDASCADIRRYFEINGYFRYSDFDIDLDAL